MTLPQNREEAISALFDGIKDELEAMVQNIESKLPTTQDHYGSYMGLITSMHDDTRLQKPVIAELLIKAGGNQNGITNALALS